MNLNSGAPSGEVAITDRDSSPGEIQVAKQEHGLTLKLAHCYFCILLAKVGHMAMSKIKKVEKFRKYCKVKW